MAQAPAPRVWSPAATRFMAELEERLARLKGSEAACVFGSGYLANIGIIPALTGQGDLILLDELSHACIHAGAQLSEREVRLFRHNDIDAPASRCLEHERKLFRHALIVTEGVFSMDGDLAPLSELSALARAHDAWLMTDDAHGIGVLGGGRGSAFVSDPPAEIPLQMGTLSKAIGSYGGYLCASREVIELMQNRARTPDLFDRPAASRAGAAAIAALDIIESEPDYAALPLQKARAFTRAVNLPAAESADRAGHDRRSRRRARGLGLAGTRRLPRRRHPPADGAGGNCAAARHVQCRTARREKSHASPISSARVS